MTMTFLVVAGGVKVQIPQNEQISMVYLRVTGAMIVTNTNTLIARMRISIRLMPENEWMMITNQLNFKTMKEKQITTMKAFKKKAKNHSVESLKMLTDLAIIFRDALPPKRRKKLSAVIMSVIIAESLELDMDTQLNLYVSLRKSGKFK